MSQNPPQVTDEGDRKESREPTPETVEEALERARTHALLTAREALLTTRALLDAVSLAFGEHHAELPTTLSGLAAGLDRLTHRLEGSSSDAWGSLLETLLDAVDSEITRWERRSLTDTDARAVLRAFLGVREALWEFGLRRSETSRSRDDATRAPARAPVAEPPPAFDGLGVPDETAAPPITKLRAQGS
jgi:hypothetical protein